MGSHRFSVEMSLNHGGSPPADPLNGKSEQIHLTHCTYRPLDLYSNSPGRISFQKCPFGISFHVHFASVETRLELLGTRKVHCTRRVPSQRMDLATSLYEHHHVFPFWDHSQVTAMESGAWRRDPRPQDSALRKRMNITVIRLSQIAVDRTTSQFWSSTDLV